MKTRMSGVFVRQLFVPNVWASVRHGLHQDNKRYLSHVTRYRLFFAIYIRCQ